MPNRSVDRHFAHYCRTRDARSLARVFDATAPELLRIALHLCGDRHRAEDLLQSTFLTAIEKAGRFDAELSVVPWMLGILANAARQQWRRDRRRPPQDAEATAPPTTDADPLGRVTEMELDDAVDRALAGLPSTYREVLVLHLRHGLTSTEIARAKGGKPATVRTQIARGMEHLRRALPAGFAAAGAAVAVPQTVIAAVRREVLRAGVAHETGGAIAGGVVGSGTLLVGVTMKYVIGGVAAALAAAVVAAWWSAAPSGEVAAVAPEGAPSALPRGEVAVANDGAPPAPQAAARAALPPADAAAVLEVAVSRAAEAVVGALVWVRQDGALHRGATEASGVVRFAELAQGECVILTDAGRDALQLQAGTNHWQVELSPGLRVVGVVADVDRRPVADARVCAFRPELLGCEHVLGYSDEHGAFAIDHVPPGTRLVAHKSGYQPSGPRHRAVDGEVGDEVEVDLRLGARAFVLRGEVRDAAGNPVPHAAVGIAVDEDARDDSRGHGALARKVGAERVKPLDRETFFVRADASGRFESDQVPVGPVLVFARAPSPRDAAIGTAIVRMTGGPPQTVVVNLERGAVVRGRVADDTGAPYAGLTLRSEWQGEAVLGNLEHNLGGWLADREAVTDANGEYALTGLLPGEHRLYAGGELQVEHRRVRREATRHRVEVPRGGEVRWDPTVRRQWDLEVVVRDAAGQPLAGWAVGVGRARLRVLRAQRTGADGRIVLRALPRGAARLVVHGPAGEGGGPHALPAVDTTIELPADGPVEVTVGADSWPGVELRGSVVHADGRPASGALELRRPGCVERLRTAVDADAGGSFSFAGLSPGPVVLIGQLRGCRNDWVLGRFEVRAGQPLDVGRLVLPAFGRLEVRVPGVTAQGDLELWIAPASGDAPGGRLGIWRQRDGKWRSDELVPGRYRGVVRQSGAVPARFDCEVRAGEATVVEAVPPDAIAQEFVVSLPPNAAALANERTRDRGRVHFSVWDRDGVLIADTRRTEPFVEPATRTLRTTLRLPPGRYLADVEDHWFGEAHPSATVSFEVAPGSAPVVVRIR